MSHVNVESLGCLSMDVPNGTTANNATLINDYLAGNWRSSALPLMFPGRGWRIAETVEMQALNGHALFGSGGEATARPESHFSTTNLLGGAVTRLIASNVADGTASFTSGPMLNVKGYGNKLDGIVLQGLWHPNSLTTLTTGYPIAEGGSHASDKRAEVGIQIEGNQNGQGTGKLCCPSTLTILHCRTAIRCIATPYEDNADQLIFGGRFMPMYCDIGVEVLNEQSLGHRIPYVDQIHCDTAFRYERGGDLWCGTLAMNGDTSRRGLVIKGNDTEVAGHFTFDQILVDATTDSACQCVEISPTSSYTAPIVNIGFLRNATNRTSNPLIAMDKNYGAVNVYGGRFFYEGMIKTTNGLSNYFPKVRVHNSEFQHGADLSDVRRLFSTDSRGYVSVSFEGCCDLASGAFYPAFEGVINITGNTSYDIVAGGYKGRSIVTLPAAEFSPADATSYYFGGAPLLPPSSTAATRHRYYFPSACRIKKANLSIVNAAGTLGSSETSTAYVRVNNSSDSAISSSVKADAQQQTFGSVDLDIPIAAGDYVEIKWPTPTWATNPTNLHMTARLEIATP